MRLAVSLSIRCACPRSQLVSDSRHRLPAPERRFRATRISEKGDFSMNKFAWPALLTALFVLVAACSRPAAVHQERTGNSNGSSAAASSEVLPGAGFAFTADGRGNSITVIDLSTGQVKSIATSISPYNVQVSSDGRLLLAVGPVAAMTGNHGSADIDVSEDRHFVGRCSASSEKVRTKSGISGRRLSARGLRPQPLAGNWTRSNAPTVLRCREPDATRPVRVTACSASHGRTSA